MGHHRVDTMTVSAARTHHRHPASRGIHTTETEARHLGGTRMVAAAADGPTATITSTTIGSANATTPHMGRRHRRRPEALRMMAVEAVDGLAADVKTIKAASGETRTAGVAMAAMAAAPRRPVPPTMAAATRAAALARRSRIV